MNKMKEEKEMGLPNEGQVAFITGAGAGIGRAIARKFADLGATVIAGDSAKDGFTVGQSEWKTGA